MDPVLKRSEGYWSTPMLLGSFSFRFSFLSWGLEFCEGGRASSLDFVACQRGEGIQKGTRETHGRATVHLMEDTRCGTMVILLVQVLLLFFFSGD